MKTSWNNRLNSKKRLNNNLNGNYKLNYKPNSKNKLDKKPNDLNSSTFLLLIGQNILEDLQLGLFDKLYANINEKNLKI